jgi:peroxiredoxin
MKFTGIVLILALLAIIPSGITACSSGADQSGLRNYSLVPDFSLTDLQGKSVSLSDFKGQNVYLNFWATTCPPCVDEMPRLQAVYDDWSKKGLVMLAIDIGEDSATVQDFIQSHSYTFPVLLDSRYSVAGKYNIRFTPTNMFIDGEGKLRSQFIGAFQNQADIEAQLNNLLH